MIDGINQLPAPVHFYQKDISGFTTKSWWCRWRDEYRHVDI